MADWIKEQQNNKDKILILTLKNSNNEGVKLVINLNNLYLLGFINNQNQYFYFNDELLEKIKQNNQNEITELEKIKTDLEKLNELIKEKNKDKTEKENLEWEIKGKLNKLKELDKLKEQIKLEKNTEKLKKNENNIKNIDELIKEQINKAKYLNKLNKKLIEARKAKLIEQINETNQKIEKLKEEIFIPIPAINYNNDKKYLDNKIKNLQGEELKTEEIKTKMLNTKVVEKYNCQKINLNYTGAYSEDGLDVVIKEKDKSTRGKDIILSKDSLNNAIANLSKYNSKQENKTIKNDLVIMIFITSEAIRFQCDEKTLKIFAEIENIDELEKIISESQNILKNIQEKIFNKNQTINWKDYTSQLRGDWKKYSEQFNKFRIEIWNKLNEFKNFLNFINDSKNELNEFLARILDYNIEKSNKFLKIMKETNLIQKINKFNLNEEEVIIFLFNIKQNIFIEKNWKKIEFNYFKPLHLTILQNNLDLTKTLINIVDDTDINFQDKNGLNPLILSIDKNNKDMVKLLIDNGANVNIQDKKISTPLNFAINENNKDMVKLLIDNGADINFQDKKQNKWTALYYAINTENIEIVKLLLVNGADNNLKIENCLTPLLYSKYKKNRKIKNILKNFQNLKSKIELLNKKIKKTQNKEEKTKIKNNLKQIEKELETLLKIELSDVITQTELGEISNNSSQTILNRVKELNSNVDINQVKIQDNSITDTTAIIESIEQNISINDTVKVVFKISKKIKKISEAQKINIKNESYFEWLKRIFLNQYNTYNNIINTNISGYKSQGDTNKTQSKNIKLSNQNIWYDVPSDNSCLFWAVATAYLLPVRNDNEEFGARFIQLFSKENIKNWRFIQRLIQQFDLTNHISRQDWYQDQTANNLVTNVFRNRVVDYIERNLDTISNHGGQLTFRNLIQENNEIDVNYIDVNYLERMRQSSAWGGTPEILAMSNMLNSNITINNHAPSQPFNQNSSNTINILHVNGNHYNFALSSQTSQIDTNYKKSTGGGYLTEEDNDIENNSLFLNFAQLKKDKYHFIDQETEQNSLKNDENLNIYLIKNKSKMINKYNSLLKEEKQQKLNEINQHYQKLSKNDKKDFIDKLKAIGTSAIGAGISTVGAKITVGGSTSTTIGAEATGETIEMTPLLSEGLTAAETLSVAEGTTVLATEGAVIGAEAGTATALAPETLGLSLVIGGLAIAGTAIIWWLSGHDNTQVAKHESHNQYNEIEKYYKFLVHDQLKLDINISEWYKIKQIYQENSNNYQEFKNKIKLEITNFHKKDHSGWGGSITDDDINILIKLIYNHFQEINNHFSSSHNHGWKIVTNTIGSYLIIEE